jgi:hypothetical protein
MGNGSSVLDLTIRGNIGKSNISGVTLVEDKIAATTTLTLTLIGHDGPYSFCNITLPKSAVTYGTAPTTYINNQLADDHGYAQDENNYYLWYKTYSNTYELSIIFKGTSDMQTSYAVIVAIISIILVVAILVPRLRGREHKMIY